MSTARSSPCVRPDRRHRRELGRRVRWHDLACHAIGLSGLAVTRDEIWVAGLIAEAGSGTSATLTVGVARLPVDARLTAQLRGPAP
jgi:hypothetical protein